MRFVSRAATLQELVWLQKAGAGDVESMLFLLNSRRVDSSWDAGELSGATIGEAVTEMLQSLNESAEIDAVLASDTLIDGIDANALNESAEIDAVLARIK